MANDEPLAILKQGVKVWNKWREENPKVNPDLSEAYLSRADLSEADLSEAYLSGADLRGADLREATLSRANLRGADLRGADLREASLHGADLREATLSEAYLSRATLSEATLSGAYLSWANLREATLSEADLRGADLRGADLRGADLRGADLRGADLNGAFCGETSFSGVDLSKVKGLEEVAHSGRSYIDVHTLYLSKGKIPDIFLRGCGIPDDFITFIPSLTGRAIEFYSCFISYSHTDQAFARRLFDTLQGRGIRCWLDEKQMNPGDDIYNEIDMGIRYWDKVLLCCSESALAEKWWVDHEIDKAFQKERELMKERKEKIFALVPLDLDGYLFSDSYASGKAQQIRSRIAADFKGWEHNNSIFEREIERVIKALKTDGGKEKRPTPKL